jgi:hypothetical protein
VRFPNPLPRTLQAIGGWGITIIVVMLAWIPFRAPDLGTSIALLSRLFDLQGWTRLSFRENFYLVTFLLLASMLLLRGLMSLRTSPIYRPAFRPIVDVAGMTAVMFLVFIFLRPISQFIYFQF